MKGNNRIIRRARRITFVLATASVCAAPATASAAEALGINFNGSQGGAAGWFTSPEVYGEAAFSLTDTTGSVEGDGDIEERPVAAVCSAGAVQFSGSLSDRNGVAVVKFILDHDTVGFVSVQCRLDYRRIAYNGCGLGGCRDTVVTDEAISSPSRLLGIDRSLPIHVRAARGPEWFNAPASVPFIGEDPHSGIASCEPGRVTGPTSTIVRSTTGSCTNGAGLTTTGTYLFGYDDVHPSLAPTATPSVVLRGGSVTLAPNASDEHAGLADFGAGASCAAPNTSTFGTHTVSCRAVDKAGNVATKDASYDVVAGFTGFEAPLNMDAVNVAKAGQTVPLKFHVVDANGPVTNLTGVTVSGRSQSCAGGTQDPIETYAAAGASGLQNLGYGYYQFSWKTQKAWSGTCRSVGVDIGDGLNHTADFRFT